MVCSAVVASSTLYAEGGRFLRRATAKRSLWSRWRAVRVQEEGKGREAGRQRRYSSYAREGANCLLVTG